MLTKPANPLTWILLLLVTLITGCRTTPSVEQRIENTHQLVHQHDWQAQVFQTQSFKVQTFSSQPDSTIDVLTIYLEGDGLAWLSPYTVSLDPTPINPIGLKLAFADTTPVAYVARPCQYLASQDAHCDQRYWTSHRFSEEVISSTNETIDRLKSLFGARKLLLVGYSGGGAIAILVAARRSDISGIITLAGNLDIETWAKNYHLTPLSGSLNPADVADKLAAVPQVHIVGRRDKTIGPDIVASYLSKLHQPNATHVIYMDAFDHYCCWETNWPQIQQQVQSILNPSQ